jgi:hypothetical protein
VEDFAAMEQQRKSQPQDEDAADRGRLALPNPTAA